MEVLLKMSIATLFAQTYYNDAYYYDTGTSTAPTAIEAGMILSILLFTLVLIAASYVVYSLLLARIFNKAGVEGWKAWVPVYNNWTLLELGDQKGYWAVLAFIPVVNIVAAVFMYIAMHNVGLKLGKEGAFVLLAIFLPIVWLIWLAVDSSTWKGRSAAPKKAHKKTA
jgi:hypothetical protein